jgi:cation diffusion facilitator CzcD-associated flavoprotein CzcO
VKQKTIVENLIIGAGPAGLAVAACLRKHAIPFEIIEQADRVGSTWHNHYDRLHLHTVKQWSNLPYLPFPTEYPLYVSRAQMAAYLEEYASAFSIKPIFDTSVISIQREGNEWLVSTDSGDYLAMRIVLATGVNRLPNIPEWPGQEDFSGTIVHSRFYKNPKEYMGKSVLVVGMGNTGAECALDLSESNIPTYLSVRSPVSIVPRDLNGRPVQVTSKMLAKLPFGLGDLLGNQIRRIYFGNLEKYGIPMSKVPPAVQLRETGKTPVIDIGTVEAIKRRKIEVLNGIDHFEKDRVIMEDGRSVSVEVVLLCTGYKSGLAGLMPLITPFLDQYGVPEGNIGSGQLESTYFVGFDNYKLGGILGTIQTDAIAIADHIMNNYYQ